MLAACTGNCHVAVPVAVLPARQMAQVQATSRQPSTMLKTAGVSLASLGTALAVRSHRREKTCRVAAAAGWKPDPARIGATLPLADPQSGVLMWDPVGFMKDNDQATFDKYRAAEVKHGRVAMMATVGLIAQHYWRFNLVTPDKIIPLDGPTTGIGALEPGQPSSVAFGVLFLMTGFVELSVLKSPEGSKPWQFGDPWGWRKAIEYLDVDDATIATYELEHGRLAMFGVIGTLSAELVSGYDGVDQWNHWQEWIQAHF